jgi:hypothetical protein
MVIVADVASARGRPRGRIPRRVVAALLGVVIAIAGIAAFGWWDTHPDLVPSVSGGITLPTRVGQQVRQGTGLVTSRGHDHVVLTVLPGGGQRIRDTGNVRGFRVTVRSVHPNVVTNTADATVRIEFCRLRLCSVVGPTNHPSAVLQPASAQLVAFITPHRPGTVHIAGFTLSYREGIRAQTQTGGYDVRLTVH